MGKELFEAWGIDPYMFLLAFAVLTLILLVLVFVLLAKTRKVFKRYDMFMRGRDADTLEDVIAQLCDQVSALQEQDLATKDLMKLINRNLVNSYQKTGLIKYNAFEGMGGQTSFALALLDLNNNGFVLNVIHSRSSCYMYIKEVHGGVADVVLGTEEKTALAIAMKNRNRIFKPEQTQG